MPWLQPLGYLDFKFYWLSRDNVYNTKYLSWPQSWSYPLTPETKVTFSVKINWLSFIRRKMRKYFNFHSIYLRLTKKCLDFTLGYPISGPIRLNNFSLRINLIACFRVGSQVLGPFLWQMVLVHLMAQMAQMVHWAYGPGTSVFWPRPSHSVTQCLGS